MAATFHRRWLPLFWMNSVIFVTHSTPSTRTLPAGTYALIMSVHRIEVHNRAEQPDPIAATILKQAIPSVDHLRTILTSRVYLIEAVLDDTSRNAVANELLTDPVTQFAVIGASVTPVGGITLEVHYQPGVMDPVAESTQEAIQEMLPDQANQAIMVRTGHRYDLVPIGGKNLSPDQVRQFAQTTLANPVINEIHDGPYHPTSFPHGQAYKLNLVYVPIRDLNDQGLNQLSKQGHLFLNLEEMRAIQEHYLQADREPTDIELETLAQTWSEHCVHKTLKATIHYQQHSKNDTSPCPADWVNRPGHTLEQDGSVTIKNLLKSTIAAATRKLMEEPFYKEWCVSVFEDNAGIVKFDDEDALCIKVETHNHPSAIEPYGGAATGIGGCIRDVMGTGLSARPIANTNVFCVASPTHDDQGLPPGVIHPKRTLQRVVAGVRDYGNRMGIPTVNGAVWFHDDYLGNPLVFAGCVGLMPLDKCFGEPNVGDRIIVLGGRTGRDGIHGATFSSAELTDTHADEFSHAVQIGNAITQKTTLDVILQARDHPQGPLFSAITDCGAGGFSSAVGEMGQKLGAHVTLDSAPLKYQGLNYTEIWISEAQERMVLAVPPAHTDAIRQMCFNEDVEYCDLGWFGVTKNDEAVLILTYHRTQVGQLSMHFVHEGLPTPTRQAQWSPPTATSDDRTALNADTANKASLPIATTLYKLLAHPNIASKHWIIRQYDHEVQGTSVIKPLVGPGQDGPSDAAVLRPKLNSTRAVAISCGLQSGLGEKTVGGDAYWMTLAAIDEAVRNCVCVGADPSRMAILDNFCWPNCDDPKQLGSLVRAAEGCYDGALAYRTPFVSGKDSLSNQFTTTDGRLITIPPTLLISAIGIVADATRCITMNAKTPGHILVLVGLTDNAMGGSHYSTVSSRVSSTVANDDSYDPSIPRVDLDLGPKTAAVVAKLIADGLVKSAHDCSDGGLLVAAAEMAFAGRVGLDMRLDTLANQLPTGKNLIANAACFAETPSRYLLEVPQTSLNAVENILSDAKVRGSQVGVFANHNRLTVKATCDESMVLDESLDDLRQAWLNPLDW